MRNNERMRKALSILLCLCMLLQNAPVMAFAAAEDNLCEHHAEHTAECGYAEGSAGSPCTHEHSESCYALLSCVHEQEEHECTVESGCIIMELDCHHVHGDCGYVEAVEPQECTTCQSVLTHAENCGYVAPVAEVTCACVPGEDGILVHTEGCGYVAGVEEVKCACEPTVTHGGEGCTYAEGKAGSPCTHTHAVKVDSADSCYKLLCSHKDGGHDDACGYAEAVEGHPCHYECAACETSPAPDGDTLPKGEDQAFPSEEGGTAEAVTEEEKSPSGKELTRGENPSTSESLPQPPVAAAPSSEGASGEEEVCNCGTDDVAIHATTCAVYVAPETAVCYCAEKCTEPNIWCDVCGFDISKCGGTDTAAAYSGPTITGISVTVDGQEHTEGTVHITENTTSVVFTVTGSGFANRGDSEQYYLMAAPMMANCFGHYMNPNTNIAIYDFSNQLSIFKQCTNFRVRYSIDGRNTWIDTDIYLTYGEEPAAAITGVSVTVDGTTYTEGNVTIKSTSSVSITVRGTNFDRMGDKHDVAIPPFFGSYINTWTINTAAGTATKVFPGTAFEGCSNSQLTYCNGSDRNETPLYLTYENVTPAEITGVSIAVDKDVVRYGSMTIAPTSNVSVTVWGTNFENLGDRNLIRLALGKEVCVADWTVDTSMDTATADLTDHIDWFASCNSFEIQYSNDGGTTWISTELYLTYDESAAAARISGVSVTVDGTTYTGGNVTIKPDSKISFTVSGTAFQNLSQDNRLNYSMGCVDKVTADYGWKIDTSENTASWVADSQIDYFAVCSNFEVRYSNDGGTTWISTGLYLTYDDGIAEEDRAKIESVSVTVAGVTHTAGSVIIAPETESVTFTVAGTNFVNLNADHALAYCEGYAERLNSGEWVIDTENNTAAWIVDNTDGFFAQWNAYPVSYSNNYRSAGFTWETSGISLTYTACDHSSGSISYQTGRTESGMHEKVYSCCGYAAAEGHTFVDGSCTGCGFGGGYCGGEGDGTNLTWTLVNNVLTISGTGAMADYVTEDFVGSPAPWSGSAAAITGVSIAGGVTDIGTFAFCDLTGLERITIPASVTVLDHAAFHGCTELQTVTFAQGSGLTSIGEIVFEDCTSLTQITIPAGVKRIGTDAFANCTGLNTVNAPCDWDGSLYTFAEGVTVNIAEHIGGTATCISKAFCSVCEGEYGELGAHTPSATGKCTMEGCGYQYPAKVGDTFYESIHKALRAAEGISGCTLTLLDDVTLTSMSSYASYVNTGMFTLDLNGKTFSSNKGTLSVLGTVDLTIRDSIGGGKIVSTYSNAIYQTGGKVTIEGGTFEGTLDGVFLSYDSTLIVKGGTFTGGRAMITGFGSDCEIDLTAIDPAGFTLKNNGSGTFAPTLPSGYAMVNGSGTVVTSLSAEESATVKASLENATVTLDKDTFTYDGKEHKPTVTVVLGDKPLTLGVDYTVIYAQAMTVQGGKPVKWFGPGPSESECINAGSLYFAVVEGIGNYYTEDTVTLCENFVIAPRPLTVKADDQTILVGGQINEESVTVTEGSLVAGHTLTASIQLGQYTEAGSVVNQPGFHEDVLTILKLSCDIMDGEEYVTDNYSISFVSGNLTVVEHVHEWSYSADGATITAECKGTIGTCPIGKQTVTVKAEGKTYDGTPVTAELEGSIEGVADPEIICSGNTNVGTYTASIKLGKATASVEFTIDRATPTVAWDNTSASVDYTGAAASITVPTVTLVNGETFNGSISYSYTGTASGNGLPTNAGTYEITASIGTQGNYNAATSTNKLTLTIHKTPSTITKAPEAIVGLKYNGQDQALITPGEAEGGTMVYSVNGTEWSESVPAMRDPNAYHIYYKVVGDSNHTDYGDGGIKFQVTIGKADMTVTAEDQTITYGEAISADAFTADDLVDGHTMTVKLTPSTTNVTVSGTITASAAVISADDVDVTGNYNVSYTSGKLVIKPDTSGIDTLTTDNVTSANEEDIKAVQEMLENADSLTEEWEAIGENCETLLDKIEAVEAENDRIADAISGFDLTTVKSSDEEAIAQLISDIDDQLATDNLTDEERSELEGLKTKGENLIAKIDGTETLIGQLEKTVDDLDAETVKSTDKATLEQLIEDAQTLIDSGNVTEAEKEALVKTQEDAKALIQVVEDTAAENQELTDQAAAFDEETVNSTDKENLEQLAEDIEALLDTDNLTEGEREALETVLEQVEDMIDTIEDTAEDSKAATEKIDALDPATVTSDDKDDLEQAIETIDELLKDDHLTEEERSALEDAKADAQALIEKIEAAQDAADTENTEKVEDVTADNVKPEDKEALEDAKADLEKALEDNAGNYTEEEKQAIRDEIQRIEDAVEALENAEDVTGSLTRLPDTVEPDDEEAREEILDAKDAYDKLTDHEKSLIEEDLKEKLEDLVAALTDYKIIKGNGGKWHKGSSYGLSFTANGPLGRFTGIQVDGRNVSKLWYEVKSGSTVVTLKRLYLGALSVGSHTITVNYSDGQATGTFHVLAREDSPGTGDDTPIEVWTGAALGSLLCVAVLLLNRKKFFKK